MKYEKNILKAKFISRPNRFNAVVELENEEIVVHVPNTGRNKEILVEGSTVYLRQEDNPNRKTKYDLIAAKKGDKLISIDSQIPNKVVNEALEEGKIDKLVEYTNILKEKTYGNSRFDFKLENENGYIYYLEVKGVTLEDKGFSMFPDAPTERGTKHIHELIEAKREGLGAGIMFLIQIEDVHEFTTHKERDPKFAEAVKEAYNQGVDIFAYNCIVTEEGIEINKPVKIII